MLHTKRNQGLDDREKLPEMVKLSESNIRFQQPSVIAQRFFRYASHALESRLVRVSEFGRAFLSLAQKEGNNRHCTEFCVALSLARAENLLKIR